MLNLKFGKLALSLFCSIYLQNGILSWPSVAFGELAWPKKRDDGFLTTVIREPRRAHLPAPGGARGLFPG